MPMILWVIWVLTCMEAFSAIEYGWAQYVFKKHANDAKKVARAKWLVKVVDWKFAAVMCIKVALENKVGLPVSFPLMWVIDMLLMNFAVAELIVKYVIRNLRSNKKPESKR